MKKIIAVVVTYNRPFLLCRCLIAINNQTKKTDRIIVIDNNSTENCQAVFQKFIFNNKIEFNVPITWIKLNENIGGAGGFSEGIQEAYKLNPDFIWLMDDDGYPDKNCLEVLLSLSDKKLFIGPIVLDDKDKNDLSFPLRIPGSLRTIRTKKDFERFFLKEENLVTGVLLPFNGVLLPTYKLEQIGFPIRDFFIWGDEVEYTKRFLKSGGKIGIAKKAIFFHPSYNKVRSKMLFGLFSYNDTDSELKLYCYCRNKIYIYRKYSEVTLGLAFAFKTIFFFGITKPSTRKLKLAIGAMWDGLKGDLTKHNKWL